MFFPKMNTIQGFQGDGRPQFFMRCPHLCNYHILTHTIYHIWYQLPYIIYSLSKDAIGAVGGVKSELALLVEQRS